MPRLIALLALFPLAACADKAEDDSASGGSEASMKAATYNAGLATGFVTFAPEREPEVITAIAGLDADVVCLQEVWTEASINAVVQGVSGTYPHSYVEVTAEEGADEPACTEEETEPLAVCARANCEGTDNLTSCVLSYCSDEFNALSDPCTECASANVGLNDVDAIVETCTTGSSRFAWGGHNGLVLLSKTEMTGTEHVNLPSWLVWRSAIGATVDGVAIGCTHLAADLSSPAYAGSDYGSYAEEQAAQIDALNAWMEDLGDGGPQVLLGDFNTGPELAGGIQAELPDNWGRVTAAGWTDPNVEQDSPFCTWCADNTIAGDGSDHEAVDTTIDHVLVKGATASEPVRVLDGTVTITTTTSGEVETSLSDHYGAAATISW